MQITTIDLDLAKHVFQVHGIDAEGSSFAAGCGARRSSRSSGVSPPHRSPRHRPHRSCPASRFNVGRRHQSHIVAECN
jgi:hypothetical protein